MAPSLQHVLLEKILFSVYRTYVPAVVCSVCSSAAFNRKHEAHGKAGQAAKGLGQIVNSKNYYIVGYG